MSKAWIENISDESIVDRYLTYCFDLNHNTEKDAPMTYVEYRFYGGPWHGQERTVPNRNIVQGSTYYISTEAVVRGTETGYVDPAVAKYGSYVFVDGDFIWSDMEEYVKCVHTYNGYGLPQLFENISVFLRGLGNVPPEYHVCLQTFDIQADPDTRTLRLRVYVTKVVK